MGLPKFSNTAALRQSYQAQFGGLNHTKGATDGDIYDMRNMTSDHYPVLSPRGRRRTVATYDTIYGLYCYGEYTFIAAEKDGDCGLYINGEKVMALEPSEKQMEVCNKKLIIFPDKVYYDLNALDSKGVVADKNALPADGNSYGDVYIVENIIGADLYYWNNTEWVKLGAVSAGMSGGIGSVSVSYYSGELYGSPVKNNSLRIESYNGEIPFAVGDAVEIKGNSIVGSNNKTAIIREIYGNVLRFSPETFKTEAESYSYVLTENILYGGKVDDGVNVPAIIYIYGFKTEKNIVTFEVGSLGYPKGYKFYWEVGSDTLRVINDKNVVESHLSVTLYGIDDEGSVGADLPFATVQDYLPFVPKYKNLLLEENVTIERVIPDFDFILSVNNRLWGVKGDTIWGSKLGDPLNWNYFDGIAIDSYSVELGTAGDVTGIANYNGYPTFFKEDGIYKLYGAYPSAYQVYATATNGVKKGCGKSIAKIGDALFYVSKAGVMMYGGGIPSYIGNELGVRIGTAVGGTDGRKYYLCADGLLYAFDSYMNLWHIEDELNATAMSYGQELLCGADGEVFTLGYTDAPDEEDVDWLVRFADAVVGSPNKKGVEKVLVRADCSGGGYCDVFISFDGGEYEQMRRIDKDTKASTILPIVLKRGDYFSLKIVGHGDVDIYSLSYSYYHGSEL